jgi:Trehalose utilisation
MRFCTRTSVLALTAALAFAGGVCGADRRLVLIAGKPSHPPGMHEFRAGCLLLQKCLAATPGIEVTVCSNGWPTKVVEGAKVDDNRVLESADAVVVYADGGGSHPVLAPGRIGVLDALAKRGGGLGFMHFGVEIPKGPGADAMIRWTEAYYEDHYSVNPMWSPQYRPLPHHPIANGARPFSNRDEWYFNLRGLEDPASKPEITAILTALPSDDVRKGPYVYPQGPYPHIVAASGRIETTMWAVEHPGGGRGFGFTGGHTHANWGDDNQRKLVLNALLWISNVDPPGSGVDSKVTPEDLRRNLDPK